MPFTPFHLGSAVLFGLLLRKYIDFPTFVLANLIVDFRATLIFFGLMEGSLHGFMHTFLFGSILGIGLGSVVYQLKPFTGETMRFFRLEQLRDLKSFLFAGVLGTWLHISFDSFLYADIQPFMPLTVNPFYDVLSPPLTVIYGLSVLSLILGVFYYGRIVYRDLSK